MGFTTQNTIFSPKIIYLGHWNKVKGFIQVSLLVPCTLSENCICKYCILVAPGQLFADLRQ